MGNHVMGAGSGPGQRVVNRRPGTGKAVFRAVLAVVLVALWLGIAGVGGPTFGKLGEVQTNDQAAFLPATAEATRALEWQAKFRTSDAIPAVVVIAGESAIDQEEIKALTASLKDLDGLDGEIVGPFASEDGLAAQLLVPLDGSGEVEDAVETLRAELGERVPAGTRAYVTGPAGFSADLVEAFGGIDGVLLGVALGAVFLILLLVYRSVLLPLTVLFTAVAALCAAILAVYFMAKEGWIRLDGQSQGILSILVIGAATDYSLLFVARHKEALSGGKDRWEAVATAWKRSAEPILASGGTVTAGLLCLLFSDLNSNKALGPIGASGIVFSIIAALTFLPAALALLGRKAYWPFMPKPEARLAPEELPAGLWGRVAGFVGRHPRPIWVLTALVLAAGALGMTQLKASGVPQSELVLGQTDSRDGQIVLGEHFPGGTGSPLFAIVDESKANELLASVQDADGVASAYLQAADGGPALAQAGREPQLVEGRSLISITLNDAADSDAAKSTLIDLREMLHQVDAGSLVGGTTATLADTATTAQADLIKIIPLILGAILVILMLLLRSILAPVLLVATTLLSYGTAMGVSAWVFNGLFNFAGADPSVPLFGFVFLVALGVDYNIFLMTRVREESLVHGTRSGVLRGLAVTGGVITSAGVVLAATFAALGIIPIMFLVQLGFIVAFGVLLDTLVVRSLLVPALVRDIGPKVWWPSKLGSTR
ncbi:efflux RND transporter permease subunit [Paeniglutamicibacter sulfureus]|uniref:MMPL family transporter n=1 Tax=Paeniglutamicibacter sulfureus TaxID=43666 RepID=UPI0026661FFA|nr:efflux RND transporter permease subunit [Paeniglutamicibacter sulfureus]MDO2935267.1 efflux RND transporter permease subunit [Paeniglutamicibacter sulfureus]